MVESQPWGEGVAPSRRTWDHPATTVGLRRQAAGVFFSEVSPTHNLSRKGEVPCPDYGFRRQN